MKKIFEFIKEHRYITLAFLVIILLLITLTIITVKKMYSASLDILVVPEEATVLIDGKEYNNGIYDNLRTGKVSVDIIMDSFEPKHFELELKENERTRLYTYLTGNDEWYKNNDDESTLYLLDIIYEYEGEQETKILQEKYPIMASLPITYEKYLNNYTEYINFRIDGGEYKECENSFCLKISDITGGNYDRAIELIREKGYNPDDYEIFYVKYSEKGSAY